MTGRRVLLGAAVIAAFCTVSIAALWWMEGRKTAPPGGDGAAVAPAPATPAGGSGVPSVVPAAAVPAAPAPAAADPAAQPAVDPPAGVRATRSAPSTTGWEDVPVATRFSDLGAGTARPVYDALAAARAQMDTCFAREPVRVTGQDPGGGYQGPAVLVLRIESRDGGLDIVGSEVESPGKSSGEAVSCVRTVLESWPIPAQAASAGRRYRLRYPLPE